MKTNTTALRKVLKQVGIMGLIAIKNEIKRSSERTLYQHAKGTDSMGFMAQNIIFHNLLMVKDFMKFAN